VLFPCDFPQVARFQSSNNAKLRQFVPANLTVFAPSCDLAIALVGETVARFFMGVHAGKRGSLPQAGQYLGDLPMMNLNAAT
jgi:hypothetical protein